MARHVMVVLSDANEGMEDQFNSWYTSTHAVDVLGSETMVSAQRYELSEDQPAFATGIAGRKFLCIYEIEADSAAEAAREIEAAGRSGVWSPVDPSMDLPRSLSAFFTPSGDVIKPRPR